MNPGPLVDPAEVPDWLAPVVRATAEIGVADLTPLPSPPSADVGRPAAVLALFGEGEDGEPDLLFQVRSDGMASHAGQVSFPGGALEDYDPTPVAGALREAAEEVGVRPEDVLPVATLPEIYLPPSDFRVTPVLGYWHTPGPVTAVSPAETAAVARIPIKLLADPANRLRVRGATGFVSSAFLAPDMLVWGFTGGLVDAVLRMGGWYRPWHPDPVIELDEAWRLARNPGVHR